MAVQQHYVKPNSQEYTDNVLSEECKQVTGLSEEHIKNAQPLEQVLDEVRGLSGTLIVLIPMLGIMSNLGVVISW